MSRIVPLSITMLENQTYGRRRVKIKTNISLSVTILMGFLAAMPPTAMAGRYDQAYGHKYGHVDHDDRHYHGDIHPRHYYKQQRRHQHAHKHHFDRHHFYYRQRSGHLKHKQRQNKYHYRHKHVYLLPRYIR